LAALGIEVIVNENRVVNIANILRDIGLENIYVIEDRDPQLEAVKMIFEETEHVGYTCLLAIANGLISYKLAVKGEKYWLEFGLYMSKTRPSLEKVLENFMKFLKEKKLNVFNMDAKVKRLETFLKSPLAARIYSNPQLYVHDLEKLRKAIAVILKANPDSKTVVFSIKMFYYAYYVSTGKRIAIPFTIPLPVDVRISALTLSSGVIEIPSIRDFRSKTYYLLGKRPSEVRKTWLKISMLCKIPSLNIDSLLWPLGVFVLDSLPRNVLVSKTLKYLKSMLSEYGEWGKIEKLVHEILKYY